jgi:uncharacterized OB-fold protein
MPDPTGSDGAAIKERIDADSPLDRTTGAPRLVGGLCADCAGVMFPLRSRCPACASAAVERLLLPDRGTLWTWTVQGFEPPSPPYAGSTGDEFVPFGVGYVELPGVLRVESRLLGDPRELEIGMELELVELEVGGDMLYAFAPLGWDPS